MVTDGLYVPSHGGLHRPSAMENILACLRRYIDFYMCKNKPFQRNCDKNLFKFTNNIQMSFHKTFWLSLDYLYFTLIHFLCFTQTSLAFTLTMLSPLIFRIFDPEGKGTWCSIPTIFFCYFLLIATV